MSNETTTGGQLAAKIARAALDVGGKLSPDKRNKEQGYDYISADKMLAMCGQALSEQGLIVWPNITEEEIVVVERQGGKSRIDAKVVFAFTVSDGADNFTTVWIGRGSDYATPDKALYKAVTSGHKYFLAKLLCIGAGNEDGEHETPEPEKPVRQPAQKPTGKPAQPPPPPDDEPEPGGLVATLQELGAEVTHAEPVRMDLETALNVKNSEGVYYGTIESEKLSTMTIGIGKALAKKGITQEERETYQFKMDAIAAILASRAEAEHEYTA